MGEDKWRASPGRSQGRKRLQGVIIAATNGQLDSAVIYHTDPLLRGSPGFGAREDVVGACLLRWCRAGNADCCNRSIVHVQRECLISLPLPREWQRAMRVGKFGSQLNFHSLLHLKEPENPRIHDVSRVGIFISWPPNEASGKKSSNESYNYKYSTYFLASSSFVATNVWFVENSRGEIMNLKQNEFKQRLVVSFVSYVTKNLFPTRHVLNFCTSLFL